jgi:hypothetical protein
LHVVPVDCLTAKVTFDVWAHMNTATLEILIKAKFLATIYFYCFNRFVACFAEPRPQVEGGGSSEPTCRNHQPPVDLFLPFATLRTFPIFYTNVLCAFNRICKWHKDIIIKTLTWTQKIWNRLCRLICKGYLDGTHFKNWGVPSGWGQPTENSLGGTLLIT